MWWDQNRSHPTTIEVDSRGLGSNAEKKSLMANAENAYNQYVDKPVTVIEDSRVIEFPKGSFDKTLSHVDNEAKNIRIIQELPKLLENSIHYGQASDRKGRPNVY
ncbi:MAG: hypothetical protein WCG34_04035, partial [Leptolinea sp.]